MKGALTRALDGAQMLYVRMCKQVQLYRKNIPTDNLEGPYILQVLDHFLEQSRRTIFDATVTLELQDEEPTQEDLLEAMVK